MATRFASALLLVLACIPAAYSQSSGIRINTGHRDAIVSLQYDEKRDLLFSAGKDGTVKIWNAQTGELRHSLLASHLPIRKIAYHPAKPQIAILEVFGPESSRISVWDWNKEKRLYDLDLNEVPLYLTYSPKGSYLVYSRADWKSLSIHRAGNGRLLPLMREGFGIVSFIALSQSEKNIMTYQPSGRIVYKELKTGKELKTVSSLPNLSQMHISQNGRYMIAQSADDLVVVDLLNGRTVAGSALPEIQSISLSSRGERIYCLSRDDEGIKLSRWMFTGGFLYTTGSPAGLDRKFTNRLGSLVMRGSDLFMGDETGKIWLKELGREAAGFSENNLLDISGYAITPDTVVLASAKGILKFDLEGQHEARYTTDLITDFDYDVLANPFSSPVGIEFTDDNELLIWDKSEKLLGMTVIDRYFGFPARIYTDISSSQLQVDYLGDRLLCLEKNGRITLLDSNNYDTLYEKLSPGMNKVLAIHDGRLLGAQSRAAQLSGSLLLIDTNTGETVPLPGTSLLAYDLAFDPVQNTIFSLGLERESQEMTTSIILHYGENFEQTRVLLTYEGEDLSAALEFDPISNELFTTLGYGGLRAIRGETVRPFQNSGHMPREVKTAGRLVLSLNQDSTLTLWDRKSGRIIVNLYVFKDFSWIAVFPNDNAYISKGADRFLVPQG